VKSAGVDELAQVEGISSNLALVIQEFLQKNN